MFDHATTDSARHHLPCLRKTSVSNVDATKSVMMMIKVRFTACMDALDQCPFLLLFVVENVFG